jgi:hypothetical protein
MGISPISNSLPDFQPIKRLASPSAPSSAKTLNSLISQSLQPSASPSSTSGAQPIDALSMLKSLMGYNSTPAADPLLEILKTNDSNDKTDSFESLLNMVGTPVSMDSLLQGMGGTGSGTSDLSTLLGMTGTNSNSESQTSDPFFDGNAALVQALQKSGMPASRITEVLNQVQISSQYNEQGTMNTPNGGQISGLLNGIG